MSDTYFIEGTEGLGVAGKMLACFVCGRKILLESVINGTSHNVSETVTCAECLHINKEFGEKHPEIVAQIEEWSKS